MSGAFGSVGVTTVQTPPALHTASCVAQSMPRQVSRKVKWSCWRVPDTKLNTDASMVVGICWPGAKLCTSTRTSALPSLGPGTSVSERGRG